MSAWIGEIQRATHSACTPQPLAGAMAVITLTHTHLHIAAEGLLVLASGSESVGGFDGELGGEDVGQLRAVAVASSSRLLLVIVVVATGEHCAHTTCSVS
jgi:hypothetical protein